MDDTTSKAKLAPGAGTLAHVGRLIGFFLFTTAGCVALAAAVLLPDMAAEADMRFTRDTLRRQVDCDRMAALYGQRNIDALRNDPTMTAELLIRHGNYKLPDARMLRVETALQQDTPYQRLYKLASTPLPRDRSLPVLAGKWIDMPTIKNGVLLLGIAMAACGFVLFGPKRSVDYGPGVKTI